MQTRLASKGQSPPTSQVLRLKDSAITTWSLPFSFLSFFSFSLKISFYSVAWTGLQFEAILLTQSSECWDYKIQQSGLTKCLFFLHPHHAHTAQQHGRQMLNHWTPALTLEYLFCGSEWWSIHLILGPGRQRKVDLCWVWGQLGQCTKFQTSQGYTIEILSQNNETQGIFSWLK